MASSRQSYVLRTAAELDAVVSPLRHHLLRALGAVGPCSVKELGAHLGRSPESLYYHVRALEKVGLIVEHATRDLGKRTEIVYATVAKRLYSDPEQTAPAYLDAYLRSVSALLRLTDRQVAAAVDDQKAARTKRPVSLRVMQVQARLTRKAQRELARRLDEVLAFVAENDDPARGERVALTVASAPVDEGRASSVD